MRTPKSKKFKLQKRFSEENEIKLIESWIASGKPASGSDPRSVPPPPKKSPIGRLRNGSFSPYVGAELFSQLPLSKKTKDGLKPVFVTMTDVQRSSLPHSLCGRDILGAAKTGSGKTLAFVIPILEKLYKARWGPEDGVGCIIISPTRELAGQIFDVLKSVGRFHGFSAGLLIGGRKDLDTEKERVNELNILVCTPGRLLQHMDETPNFECSQLQVLVLDEADRILDQGFKKDVNAIISQLPKFRQTLLFSATQTKSVKDLARLSLKDPEYISVHEESETATPSLLEQTAMIVPLDQKLDMLWSFLRAHIHSRIVVFLSTRKQVKFVFETFKKLRPGISLKCLHSKVNQNMRPVIYEQFCEKQSVLFCTDIGARGLDFNKCVDWVVQVDCPDDVDTYIHRVGRTARYLSSGKSIIFLTPSEKKMLEKLEETKIPVRLIKHFKISVYCGKHPSIDEADDWFEHFRANTKRLEPVSGLLAALLVKYPNLQQLAQKAFTTYLKSIYKKKDKEVFDVNDLPIDEFSASLGIPMTPKIRFAKMKGKGKKLSNSLMIVEKSTADENPSELLRGNSTAAIFEEKEEYKVDEGLAEFIVDEVFLEEKDTLQVGEENTTEIRDSLPGTRILKKKKLKINVNRPVGTRVVFDDEGNTLPPLARLANISIESDSVNLDKNKVYKRYTEMRESMKMVDKEDKALDRQRRKEKRIKQKMKLKRGRDEEDENGDDAASEDVLSGSDQEVTNGSKAKNKKTKIYFDSDSDGDGNRKKRKDGNALGSQGVTLAEQEELALKLLSSMHS